MQEATIELLERFDYAVLTFIINNFDSFNFRESTDTQETLSMITRYKATSTIDGTKLVKYRKATGGHGRYFAERGLSLQCMAREIRNAISFPYYIDLDFQNCHPNLLKQKCEMESIPCPLLAEYCKMRDTILDSLHPCQSNVKH